MRKVYYVELVRMKMQVLTVEPVDDEIRLFSSIKKAVKWLENNGFVYGQRSFFNYPEDEKEWFHKDDICMEHVDAAIIEMSVDDLSESKFKNLGEIHREWLPKSFIEFEEGREEGRLIGQNCVNQLTKILIEQDRIEDLKRATRDRKYQEALFKEFGI